MTGILGRSVTGSALPASLPLLRLYRGWVSGARKPATLETGLTVQVPLFIENGERVKVDTRSGEYLSRA